MLSWANVSIEDYENGQDPVVFIGRQGNAGVVSWSIPLQPEGLVRGRVGVSTMQCRCDHIWVGLVINLDLVYSPSLHQVQQLLPPCQPHHVPQ